MKFSKFNILHVTRSGVESGPIKEPGLNRVKGHVMRRGQRYFACFPFEEHGDS